jgi:hypothetical protein
MFLCGVPGIFDSFEHLIAKLRAQVSQIKPRHLIVVGTSGGGHTALLLGHLLQANLCVAFSPYPYLSDDEFIRLNDPALQSFHQVLERVRKSPKEARQYFDVKDTLQEWNGVTEYFIHVSRDNEWDVARASTLAALPHVKIIKHIGSAHALVSAGFLRLGLLKHCFDPNQEEFFRHFYSKPKSVLYKQYH